MIFNEVYGRYYAAITKIIESAARGELDDKKLVGIVMDNAFSESIAVIPDAIKSGRWPVVDEEYSTPFTDVTMPLTNQEKMWLKALLSDPRIRLFTDDIAELEKGLEDVEPLYEPDFFVHFDRYGDGDDFEDEKYIRNFRTIMRAIREGRKLYILHQGRWHRKSRVVSPLNIEYSAKDDKFRLIALQDDGRGFMLNLSNIIKMNITPEDAACGQFEAEKAVVEMILLDERNALERAMLQFSDLEKETVKLDDYTYNLKLTYYKSDETEILIRILAFGPMLKVVGPDDFLAKVKQRVMKQNTF